MLRYFVRGVRIRTNKQLHVDPTENGESGNVRRRQCISTKLLYAGPG